MTFEASCSLQAGCRGVNGRVMTSCFIPAGGFELGTTAFADIGHGSQLSPFKPRDSRASHDWIGLNSLFASLYSRPGSTH